MPSYLVETYLARGHSGERAARVRQARSACDELTREGTRVVLEHSIYVPDDEICFFTFTAASRRVAGMAALRARLEPIRVVEVDSSAHQGSDA